MEVKEAALRLDRHTPGWEFKVNPQTLSLRSNEDCILGQLYGSFYPGMLYLWDNGWPFVPGGHRDSPFIEFGEDKTTQWLNEIFERRSLLAEYALTQEALVAA